ncbi:hypothetical protein K6I34_002864 [Streptomyces sp. UNOC14_S4]|nr:hypothetical protein [Streptomyces sp. UNOC14_S4]MCC3770361.1 hypothetical protein [Streptomyces sp. UNOC14_S4]
MTFTLHADVSVVDTDYGTALLDESNGRYWHAWLPAAWRKPGPTPCWSAAASRSSPGASAG